ncbi:MAG: oligosaccharide flippase family protein [Tannerellaceae bacterium]|nr:oligosaccharide flippase family protein [Tannerellaceae bacterium]
MSDKQLLLKNSLSGVIQLVVTAVLTLICVPFLISKLGMEVYGIFAVLSVIGNLSTLADLGMDRALIVYLSRQGRSQESDYDIIIALGIKTLLLCLVITGLLVFQKFILLSLFNIPDSWYDEAADLYRLLIFSNALMIIGMTFVSVLDSLQKVYLNSYIRFLYSLVYWLGILFIIFTGKGLRGIGDVSVISAIIWLVFTVSISLRYWGRIQLRGIGKNVQRIINKQIVYSSKIFSASILNLFFEPLSKILISNFIGLHAVALFDVALRIRGQIASLFSKVIYPLGPYIANQPKSEFLNHVIIDITKKIQLIVIPVAIIFVFVSKILIYLWMGEENLQDLSVYVAVLCAGFLLFVPPTYPIYQYLYTKSLAEKTILTQLVNVLVNTVIFLILYRVCGIYAILFANTAAYFCAYLLSFYYLKRYLQLDVNKERWYVIKTIFSIIGLWVTGLVITLFLQTSIWDILIYPVCLGLIYLLYIKFAGLINKEDISRYFSGSPEVEKLLSRIFF